jgi:hypothetical protein
VKRSFTQTGGLGAIAGGWNLMLQSPLVLAILTVAFGLGFYLVVRLTSQSH